MEREQYFEAVQDVIEGLETMLKHHPEEAHRYRPIISQLEYQLDTESQGIEIALWLQGGINGQA